MSKEDAWSKSGQRLVQPIISILDIEELDNYSQEPIKESVILLRDSEGNTILHWLSMLGDVKAIKRINTKFPELLFISNNKEHSPIHVAVAFNQVKVVEYYRSNQSTLGIEDQFSQEGVPTSPTPSSAATRHIKPRPPESKTGNITDSQRERLAAIGRGIRSVSSTVGRITRRLRSHAFRGRSQFETHKKSVTAQDSPCSTNFAGMVAAIKAAKSSDSNSRSG